MSIARSQLWIGLVELCGSPDNVYLEGGTGAFANLVAMASDEEQFEAMARQEAAGMGLTVEQVEWARPLRAHLQGREVSQRLLDLASLIDASMPAAYDVLHVWEELDEGDTP